MVKIVFTYFSLYKDDIRAVPKYSLKEFLKVGISIKVLKQIH